GLGDASLSEALLGYLRRVLALELERGLIADGVAYVLLADAVTQVARALREQLLADEGLQDLILHHVLHGGWNVPALALLDLGLLIQPGIAGFLDGNLLAARFRGIGADPDIQIDDAVSTPGREDQCERAQHDVHEPFVALQSVSNALEHVPGSDRRMVR